MSLFYKPGQESRNSTKYGITSLLLDDDDYNCSTNQRASTIVRRRGQSQDSSANSQMHNMSNSNSSSKQYSKNGAKNKPQNKNIGSASQSSDGRKSSRNGQDDDLSMAIKEELVRPFKSAQQRELSTDSEQRMKLQVIILGDLKVGKTTLFHRFMHANSQSQSEKPTTVQPIPQNNGLMMQSRFDVPNGVFVEIDFFDFHTKQDKQDGQIKINSELRDLVANQQLNQQRDTVLLIFDPKRPETLKYCQDKDKELRE